MSDFDALLARVRACRVCAEHIEPRPVLSLQPSARLLVIGQAPGRVVHGTGVPWNDASGLRLRAWLGLDDATFFDPARVGILPTGLCFPGTGRSGDLPPRPECAPLWHPQIRPHLTALRLTLLIGQYAQAYVLGERRKSSLTETVAAWREYLPSTICLPHPSPRNRAWLVHNPWFEAELLPELKTRVAAALSSS